MSRQQTRRKCHCCTKSFIPDPRNQSRQHYCPQPACRQASKAASQRRWLSKAANRDYFRGADQVRRVQFWRKSHPGYWRKKAPSSQGPQAVEAQSANLGQTSCNVPRVLPRTLQDFCLAQDPAFVGLISMVTGSTLQEDISHHFRGHISHEQDCDERLIIASGGQRKTGRKLAIRGQEQQRQERVSEEGRTTYTGGLEP